MIIEKGNRVIMTRGDDDELTAYCSKPFVSGDVAELTVRRSSTAKKVLIHKIVTDFSEKEGKAVFHFDPEDTHPLEFGQYEYDVQVTFQDIGVKTIIKPSPFVIGEECTYE